jgi:hypothetical protein
LAVNFTTDAFLIARSTSSIRLGPDIVAPW